MENLFVIVHGELISIERELARIQHKPYGHIEQIISELQRIRDEETHISLPLTFLPRDIPYQPYGKHILVCGAYGDIFVASHVKLLQEQGICAQTYEKATLFSRDSVVCSKKDIYIFL